MVKEEDIDGTALEDVDGIPLEEIDGIPLDGEAMKDTDEEVEPVRDDDIDGEPCVYFLIFFTSCIILPWLSNTLMFEG